uniref:Geminin coiled-coil domain containing n=1 Tax=Salmo trutta TaxID=8032 RepID=A0A674EE66_SALTR
MSYPSCLFVLQRTAQTCQDLSFVGGQLYDCPYPAPTSADSVDVSTVTLASFWAAGSPDNTACQQEPTQRELLSCLDCGTSPPDPNWNDHLSPHLQRNKQLQDTLIQREEELARLQEENNNLKEFLNSSCVKALEKKNKNLHGVGEFRNLSASQLLLGSQVKRTCRNLSLEFCSEEELACTDSVDLWILQTLGLKDEDTIDTSSTEYSFNCSISSLTKCSSVTDSSGDYCQTTDHKNTAYDSPTDGQCNGDRSPGLHHTPSLHCRSPSSPIGGDVMTTPLSTPSSQTELAFSISLSPSSSVRLNTHSFPQGQAFVRKNTQGGWNFTWVPKQGP